MIFGFNAIIDGAAPCDQAVLLFRRVDRQVRDRAGAAAHVNSSPHRCHPRRAAGQHRGKKTNTRFLKWLLAAIIFITAIKVWVDILHSSVKTALKKMAGEGRSVHAKWTNVVRISIIKSDTILLQSMQFWGKMTSSTSQIAIIITHKYPI
jgi:hypothetical protein